MNMAAPEAKGTFLDVRSRFDKALSQDGHVNEYNPHGSDISAEGNEALGLFTSYANKANARYAPRMAAAPKRPGADADMAPSPSMDMGDIG